MQKLAEICIRRPVFAAMIVLSLVVVGAASYFKLGVDRFPSVDLPTISVRTGLPGASPEEVESLVSQPIEEVVNTVDGIDELRGVARPVADVLAIEAIEVVSLCREVGDLALWRGLGRVHAEEVAVAPNDQASSAPRPLVVPVR